jgi:hypothetical protein
MYSGYTDFWDVLLVTRSPANNGRRYGTWQGKSRELDSHGAVVAVLPLLTQLDRGSRRGAG